MEFMSVPPWLKALLSNTTFFSECPMHSERFRIECNMYCIDCSDGKALCFKCIEACHKDHKSIQIRKSTYHNVVRTNDIKNELNIREIQTYVINSFNVVFLNKRSVQKPKTQKAGKCSKQTSMCETCRRHISNSFRFCSLGCKFAWIMESESGSVSVSSDMMSTNKAEEHTRKLEEEEITKSLPSQKVANSNSRKRKGIPRRAPFF